MAAENDFFDQWTRSNKHFRLTTQRSLKNRSETRLVFENRDCVDELDSEDIRKLNHVKSCFKGKGVVVHISNPRSVETNKISSLTLRDKREMYESVFCFKSATLYSLVFASS